MLAVAPVTIIEGIQVTSGECGSETAPVAVSARCATGAATPESQDGALPALKSQAKSERVSDSHTSGPRLT